MSEKLRVHNLADELGVASKEIIAKCKAEGIDLKNHMAVISIGLAESIREWFSSTADITSVELADKVDLAKVSKPRKRKKHGDENGDDSSVATATATEESMVDEGQSEVAGEEPVAVEPTAATPESPPEIAAAVPPPVEEAAQTRFIEQTVVVTEAAAPAEPLPATPAPVKDEPTELRPAAVAPVEAPPAPVQAHTPERKAPGPRRPPTVAPPRTPPKPVIPAGPQLVPKPAELKGPRVVRVEAPEPVRDPRPRSFSPAPAAMGPPRAPVAGAPPRRGKRGGRAAEDDGKVKSKNPRRRGDGGELAVGERLQEWRDQDLLELKERVASATGHGIRDRQVAERRRQTAANTTSTPAHPQRKAEIQITTPIVLKDFCAAIGVPYPRLLPKLREQTGALPTINSTIDQETAELLALEVGITLQIVRAKSASEELEEEFSARERKHPQKRPPVVTMLGHVDHGKTSLLDAIRKTNVAGGEAGGITQTIGAYRIDRGEWHVTFLDTPGHQAFTEMRSRGANLTDVVVLVVAADDGVMPQTVEAINHAKAAKAQIVVALNKIDMPNADTNRIFGQLAEQGLTVNEWGGDVDVVRTSATKGTGIAELIEHLSTFTDLLDLQADPTVPATGLVIEARMKEGKGPVATVLIREGTLRPGQTIVCGPASGKVRLLTGSNGEKVSTAGPGTPVEISGLDELPAAGDKLYQINDMARAKRIATEVKQERRDQQLLTAAKPRTLEELFKDRKAGDVPELNVIVKADGQGSLDAVIGQFQEINSSQVTLKILHSAVGAISEADVRLAEVSDSIVMGYNVVAEDRAQQLAEQVGVQIRSYRVIYEALDDIRKALEGLLEPEIQIAARGKVLVKEVFNLSKFGVVAGCEVSDGVVARNHKLRIVRDGRVVRDNVEINSLKRHKNDAKEVAAGFECGIKLSGFDDIKIGDVFESYEVTEVARKL